MIRISNKHLLNPLMMHLAGRRFWYASVIEHTGRHSGKTYSTPVVADLAGDHVLIPLPYGTAVDWVRNVIAAGGATIVSKGRAYSTTAPTIIGSAEALPLLPRARRRTFERVHIEHFLRLSITR